MRWLWVYKQMSRKPNKQYHTIIERRDSWRIQLYLAWWLVAWCPRRSGRAWERGRHVGGWQTATLRVEETCKPWFVVAPYSSPSSQIQRTESFVDCSLDGGIVGGGGFYRTPTAMYEAPFVDKLFASDCFHTHLHVSRPNHRSLELRRMLSRHDTWPTLI